MQQGESPKLLRSQRSVGENMEQMLHGSRWHRALL